MDTCSFYLTILLCCLSVQRVTCSCDEPYDSDSQWYWKAGCRVTEVPRDIPAQAARVVLSRNNISNIRDGAFRHLSGCTWLALDDNELTEVRAGAFQGLVSLETLELQRNNIRVIEPGAFRPLTSMNTLWLEGNELITLEEGSFTTPLQTPLELDLKGNTPQCDQRMCWIKQAEREGHITRYTDEDWNGRPQCKNYPGVHWDNVTLGCSEPECYRASNITQCSEGQFCFSARSADTTGDCTQAVRCSTSSDCSSTDGSTCIGGYCQPAGCSTTGQCVHGFTCNNGTCVDIDECEEDASLCENGWCVNTPGSFSCICDTGYIYNQMGHICDDIDECTRGDHRCRGNTICENHQGSYQCTPCPVGYSPNTDRTSCLDIDECEEDASLCENGRCRNTPGSYECDCDQPLHVCRPDEGLTNVPTDIPTNTTDVNLKNNSIEALDNNSFEGLNVLINLSLSNNHISEIAPGTFQDQKNLTFLDLGYNNLTTINGTMWEGLDNVTTLRLTGNDIKTIETRGFSNLPKLKFIIISITVVIIHKETILAKKTYPDTPDPPKLSLEGETIQCNESSCWLKRQEARGFITYTTPSGTIPKRLKCINMNNKYWDEVDLNCSREFYGPTKSSDLPPVAAAPPTAHPPTAHPPTALPSPPDLMVYIITGAVSGGVVIIVAVLYIMCKCLIRRAARADDTVDNPAYGQGVETPELTDPTGISHRHQLGVYEEIPLESIYPRHYTTAIEGGESGGYLTPISHGEEAETSSIHGDPRFRSDHSPDSAAPIPASPRSIPGDSAELPPPGRSDHPEHTVVPIPDPHTRAPPPVLPKPSRTGTRKPSTDSQQQTLVKTVDESTSQDPGTSPNQRSHHSPPARILPQPPPILPPGCKDHQGNIPLQEAASQNPGPSSNQRSQHSTNTTPTRILPRPPPILPPGCRERLRKVAVQQTHVKTAQEPAPRQAQPVDPETTDEYAPTHLTVQAEVHARFYSARSGSQPRGTVPTVLEGRGSTETSEYGRLSGRSLAAPPGLPAEHSSELQPDVPEAVTEREPLLGHPQAAAAYTSHPGSVKKVKSYSIETKNVLGTGAFGVVFKGSDPKGNTIAAKRIDGDKHPRVLTHDVDRLVQLDHQNVMRILDVEKSQTVVWMVMPFCEVGDLNHYFRQGDVPHETKVDVMRQIAAGIRYLHQHDIVHRDIKPGNILVASDHPLVIQLADFDLCKCLDPEVETSLMTSNVGTLAFKAPEFFQRTGPGHIEYHRNVDVYAAGLTFLAILQADKDKKMLIPQIETPMEDSELHAPSIGLLITERVKYNYSELGIVKIEGPLSSLKSLIDEMTRVDPNERLSAEAVERHLEKEASVGSPSPEIPESRLRTTPTSLDSAEAQEAVTQGESPKTSGCPESEPLLERVQVMEGEQEQEEQEQHKRFRKAREAFQHE